MYQYFSGILLFFLGVAICHTQPRPVFCWGYNGSKDTWRLVQERWGGQVFGIGDWTQDPRTEDDPEDAWG